MLKFYVRHGMVIDKLHDIKSFKQSKWLGKYNYFKTQKRNQAVNDFENDFYKLINSAFLEKLWKMFVTDVQWILIKKMKLIRL